jgi:hypothetical protein
MQAHGRAREAARRRNGKKIAKMAQFHQVIVSMKHPLPVTIGSACIFDLFSRPARQVHRAR